MFSSLVKVQLKKLLECKNLNLSKKVFISFFVDNRIGFKNMTTIEKVCAAFPELDMVNHMNRVKLVSEKKKDFYYLY